MKYITLIIGLLVVGCSTPVKELTLREKVVGAYEIKEGERSFRLVLLEDGHGKNYLDGKKKGEVKWEILDVEMHIIDKYGVRFVSRINKDGSLTDIAVIDAVGKRKDIPKDKQVTIKKIK